jgi:hypothetical protein
MRRLQYNSAHIPSKPVSMGAAITIPHIIEIERDITVDLDDHPWPPPGDGWVLIYSAGGRTIWRRLLLQT